MYFFEQLILYSKNNATQFAHTQHSFDNEISNLNMNNLVNGNNWVSQKWQINFQIDQHSSTLKINILCAPFRKLKNIK